MSKFKVGDLVVTKDSIRAHSSSSVYKVAIIYNGSYLVEYYGYEYFTDEDLHVDHQDYNCEPGTRGWQETFQRYREEDLFSHEEAKVEHKRVTEAESQLEKDFKSIKSQVEEKMNAAAKLIIEANALVLPLDRDLSDLISECRPLAHALNDGGWRHSNFRC